MQVVSNDSLNLFQRKRANDMCAEAKKSLDALSSSADVEMPERVLRKEGTDWLLAPVYTSVTPNRTVFKPRNDRMQYQDVYIRTVPLNDKTPPSVVSGKLSTEGNIASVEEVRTFPREGQNFANASVEIDILSALVREFIRIAKGFGVSRFATAYLPEFKHPHITRQMIEREFSQANAPEAIAS